MSYVFDTNIVVAALNGHPAVRQRLNNVSAGEGLLPAMTLAELRFGAQSSTRVAENMKRVDRILELLTFVPVDQGIVERFGVIKADRALHDGTISHLVVENWLSPPRADTQEEER